MKKINGNKFCAFTWGVATAQKIAFEEYNLDNGMHVILHHDCSVVITSVMYHVGSKMKTRQNRICPFFEHLLLKEQLISNVENGSK
jgi:hypothetical protein